MEEIFRLVCFSSFFLAGCAGSGGTVNTPSSVAIPPVQPPAAPVSPVTPTATTTDERIKFDTFSRKETLPSGDATLTYKVGEFKPSDAFPKTEKYKIADYNFFEVTIKGLNSGCPTSECGDEYAAPGPWNHRPAAVLESDINGDGHKDFYLVEWIHGTRNAAPNDQVFAFINDGNGHFKLSPNVFATGSACMQQGGENSASLAFKSKTSECGYTTGPLRHAIIADFNNDGMDDLFGSMVLQLSDKGVLHNKTLTNIPDYFRSNHMDALFTHDQVAGDATGDKNLDIFIPSWHHAEPGYWGDGTKIAGCSNCVATVPWSLLVNDGTGKFALNQNFPILGVGQNHPLLKGFMPHNGDPAKGVLWGGPQEILRPTTASIGDFDRDGFGDIAVGWSNPRVTETWGLGKNSAGAVYYNDGKNDWRNRSIVPLPANWYGANGNANDMQVLDFNGDGWVDIILASTKHEPYYQGRIIQFFANNKDGTFVDVTKTTHPDTAKYENGLNVPRWNGEGQLKLLDFDHDGDADIVDVASWTYVLLNEGNGKYKMYDHTNFPMVQNSDIIYYPVEIDGKYQYDFISYRTTCETDQCTTSYYQVLDPPATSTPSVYDLMLDDFTRKPSTYTTMASLANRAYSDLFYYSRWNTNNARVFSTYNNGISTVGGTFGNSSAGITVMNAKSSSASATSLFTADTDAVGVYANRNNIFAMVGYSHSRLNGKIASEYFGTANSNTTADTFGAELSYKDSIGKFNYSIGSRYNSTTMRGFAEQGSTVNLNVGNQTYNSANFVATLDYFNFVDYRGIRFFYGADLEYLRYFYNSGNDVSVSTGGNFASVRGTNNLSKTSSTVSLNTGAWLTPNTNVLFSVSNVTKDPSYSVSIGYRF